MPMDEERKLEMFSAVDAMLWESYQSNYLCNPALSERTSKLINAYLEMMPTGEVPGLLKLRLELHELLQSVIKGDNVYLIFESQDEFLTTIRRLHKNIELTPNDEEAIRDAESTLSAYRKLLFLEQKHAEDGESAGKPLPEKELFNTVLDLINVCPVLEVKYPFLTKDCEMKLFSYAWKHLDVRSDIKLAVYRSLCSALGPFHRHIGMPAASGPTNEIFVPPTESPIRDGERDDLAVTPLANDAVEEMSSSCKKYKEKKRNRSSAPPKTPKKQEVSPGKQKDLPSAQKRTPGSSRRESKRANTSMNTTTSELRTKWSEQETTDLVTGVKKHGVGKWATILEDPSLNLGGRTNVNLKDKWRNLKKNFPSLKRYG